MKCCARLILTAGLGIAILSGSIGMTRAGMVDLETTIGDGFQAWTSTEWLQTTQGDFEAGVSSEVDTSASPGDVVLASGSGGDWYNGSWHYRRQITIDHTRVNNVSNPSSTYADFPMLVFATGLSNINANGTDIRFTASNGITELPREIERYSDGTLYAWVKVTLTKDAGDSTDDTIYMYYGNPAATEPPAGSDYGSEKVWNSQYRGIWHLNETVNDEQTTGTHYDSTSNGYNGAQYRNNEVGGKIADGQNFDGNDYINVSGISAPTNKTISLWINPSSLIYDFHTLIEFGNDSPWFGLARWYGYWYPLEYGTTCWGEIAVSTGQWVYLVFTSDSGTNRSRIYINGVDHTESTSYASTATGYGMGIAYHNGDQYFNGQIDEVRVSNMARGAPWIQSEYNNQNSPALFCQTGQEQELSIYGGPGTLASQVLDTATSGARWDGLFWNVSLPAGTGVTFEARASDTVFAAGAGSPAWSAVGGTSPVTAGLPMGRYMQWRATLTTSDPAVTPTLSEVIVYHY